MPPAPHSPILPHVLGLILADGINLPFVLAMGIAVLIPLMAFEVFIEALILRRIWRQPFVLLCYFTLIANTLSLLAGIPIKILNGTLYSKLLPPDLPGYFSRYPGAVALGSLLYFLSTIVVEGVVALLLIHKFQFAVSRRAVWRGILLANLATYAVLAPLHYFLTRPTHNISEFTPDTHWAQPGNTQILFVAPNNHLTTVQADGSNRQELFPAAVRDYLISEDLGLCAYRGTDNKLYLYRRDRAASVLLWDAHERFSMLQVGFNSSGSLAAFVSKKENYVQISETFGERRSKRITIDPLQPLDDPSLAWSVEENTFYFRTSTHTNLNVVRVQPDLSLIVAPQTDTNRLQLSRCFGRADPSMWFGGDDWGCKFENDTCGRLELLTYPGLGSGLRLSETNHQTHPNLYLAVNPGLLHFAYFSFEDCAFLPGCDQSIFDAEGYLYILDLNRKRVGTLTKGTRFSLLTDRYLKRL